MDKIILFVTTICKMLKIKTPEIDVSSENMQTKTQLAALINEKLVLRSSKFTPDTAFAIAHELRHQWQIKNDYMLYFREYKTVGTVTTEEYNRQYAEIDANAFGTVIMSTFFDVKPLFKGLTEEIKQAIYERAKAICQEEDL
jgi:hypothetical protein